MAAAERDPRVAHAADWDPRDPEVLGNQIHAYDGMRASCPVAHSDYLGWSVFRHKDVVAVVTDHDTFSSAVSRYPAVPNGYDPPRHDPYREIVDHYFTDEHMAAFEPACRAVAREMVGRLTRGETVEFIADFALNYALKVQGAWLGWPGHTEEALRHWTASNHRATLARDREQLDAVATEFDATMRRVLDDRRATRDEGTADAASASGSASADIISELLGETIDGVPLRDDEIVSILRNWTVGELGTMSASVGILVAYLAEHPDVQDDLRNNPSNLPAAIDEILRMHAPLVANRRVATRDVELGGRRIFAGDRITVIWASANRDEAVFGEPDDYQPERNADRNLLYGRGIHDCPGAPLARLQLRVVLEELLAAVNAIEVADASPADFASYPASGFRTLPLIFR